MSSRNKKSGCFAVRLKYPETGKTKTRLGSSIGMENGVKFAIAMFADLVDRFLQAKNIPVVVIGSHGTHPQNYERMLAAENVNTRGIEYIIDETTDRASSVRDAWRRLLPRFNEGVVQCAADVPYYHPVQYRQLMRP